MGTSTFLEGNSEVSIKITHLPLNPIIPSLGIVPAGGYRHKQSYESKGILTATSIENELGLFGYIQTMEYYEAVKETRQVSKCHCGNQGQTYP